MTLCTTVRKGIRDAWVLCDEFHHMRGCVEHVLWRRGLGTKRRRLERAERGPWMERKLTKSSTLYPSNAYGHKEKRVELAKKRRWRWRFVE